MIKKGNFYKTKNYSTNHLRRLLIKSSVEKSYSLYSPPQNAFDEGSCVVSTIVYTTSSSSSSISGFGGCSSSSISGFGGSSSSSISGFGGYSSSSISDFGVSSTSGC